MLDYGCGLGYWLQATERTWETYGVDISTYAITKARENAPMTKFELLKGSHVPFPDNFFDVVTAFDVLEHIQQPANALAELSRVSHPGGILVISVPNLASIGIKWKGKEWVNYRDRSHCSLLEKSAWLALLHNAGYQSIDSFMDGLYDSPYWPIIPTLIQHFMFKIPMTLLFGLGVRFPERYGESLIIVSRKELSL
jgi:ubiquinone/menaquinone biosynthesis C-methylase UbiE